MKTFYRLRGTKHILDELENQYILFSSPSELNDPMEGVKDIFWKGDEIVWTNFFRRYLFCLEHVYALAILCTDNDKITHKDIPIFSNLDNFPTKEYSKMFSEIENIFWGNMNIMEYVQRLSCLRHPIRKNELLTYLRPIHSCAISATDSIYQRWKLVPHRDSPPSNPINLIAELNNKDIFKQIATLVKESGGDLKKIEKFFSCIENTHDQIILANKCKVAQGKNNIAFVLFDFPEKFLTRLESILYPEWYSASFMASYSNSSTWSHYGDSHKGVCLVFNSEDDGSRLSLEIPERPQAEQYYGKSTFLFHKIDYENGFPQIDFFKSIGTLPFDKLIKDWYSNDRDQLSVCSEWIGEEDEWRNAYWNIFSEIFTFKTKEWKHENEYRLVLNDGMRDYSRLEYRKLRYKFSSLDGIIFGINTDIDLKREIIKIIERKCKTNNRNNFSFYQAYFCHEKMCIEANTLSLLKFQQSR